MNDPPTAVKDKLVADGVGGFGPNGTGWRIFIGQFPASPDTVILLNQVGGRPPYPHLRLNFPSVQATIRGKESGYVDARSRMKMLCDALLGMGSMQLNGDWYRSCNQMGDVIYLGQDENERPMFSANFWFIVEPATGTHRVPIT